MELEFNKMSSMFHDVVLYSRFPYIDVPRPMCQRRSRVKFLGKVQTYDAHRYTHTYVYTHTYPSTHARAHLCICINMCVCVVFMYIWTISKEEIGPNSRTFYFESLCESFNVPSVCFCYSAGVVTTTVSSFSINALLRVYS